MINISRSKGNQVMEFDQLIEYNMRKSFIEKPCSKCGGETFPRPFFEKSKLSISLYQLYLKFYTVCFHCIPQVKNYRNIFKLSCRALSFTSYKASFKNKKGFGTSLHIFLNILYKVGIQF